MNTEIEQKTRVKRTPKERGVGQLLDTSKEIVTNLLQTVERAIQAQRGELAKREKKAERVQAILQQNFDIRGQIRRGWLAIPEHDRQTLEDAGYYGPRKDRT